MRFARLPDGRPRFRNRVSSILLGPRFVNRLVDTRFTDGLVLGIYFTSKPQVMIGCFMPSFIEDRRADVGQGARVPPLVLVGSGDIPPKGSSSASEDVDVGVKVRAVRAGSERKVRRALLRSISNLSLIHI